MLLAALITETTLQLPAAACLLLARSLCQQRRRVAAAAAAAAAASVGNANSEGLVQQQVRSGIVLGDDDYALRAVPWLRLLHSCRTLIGNGLMLRVIML
jgi:hypothetical protein